MKRIVLAAAAALLMTGTAQADGFANMYGNTVTITTPDGKTAKAYVNQDGSWEQHMADGSVLKGTFAWKDASNVCFTMTDPAPKPGTPPGCSKIDDHKVGDTWTEKEDDGATTTYSLTAGR